MTYDRRAALPPGDARVLLLRLRLVGFGFDARSHGTFRGRCALLCDVAAAGEEKKPPGKLALITRRT